MDVPNVIKELVKNSIDAQCTVLEIELSNTCNTFDMRVTDDGCGFNELILHDVGQRQVLNSSNDEFRYGKKGKSLLTIAQIVEEMYIKSTECNSNVRFNKSINIHKSEINVYRTSREWKDDTFPTAQGASVVLHNLSLQNVIDAVSVKNDIIKGVTELGLINYNTKISIKDKGTGKILYETDGMDTLFGKFEHFLESNQVFSKLRFVSCQKDNVKVELFLCENGISSKTFQFVYLNKSIESDGKLKQFINALCEKQFENDLNAKFAVYLVDIRVKNHLDNILVDNVIINNCIKKCIEQMSQSSSKCNAAEGKNVRENNSQKALENLNKGHLGFERQVNCNETKIQGVRLGDWIFNNSCENDRKTYRNKVCKNCVINLENPKPKDTNDSLNFVEIENMQRDDDKFKKPMGKPIRKSRPCIVNSVPSVSQPLSPQLFEPSKCIEKFNSSSLMRASKQLITNRGKDLQIETNMNMVAPDTSFHPTQHNQSWPKESLFNSVHQRSSRTMSSTHMPTPPLFHIPSNNLSERSAFNSPIQTPNNDLNVNDRLQIHRSVKETFEFQFHNNHHKSNINIFENNRLSANVSSNPPQSRNHVHRYESSVHGTSQTHYRRRSNSLSTFHRSEVSSRVSKNRRSKSRSSSNSRTTTVATKSNHSSAINDDIRQSGWPITININLG